MVYSPRRKRLRIERCRRRALKDNADMEGTAGVRGPSGVRTWPEGSGMDACMGSERWGICEQLCITKSGEGGRG